MFFLHLLSVIHLYSNLKSMQQHHNVHVLHPSLKVKINLLEWYAIAIYPSQRKLSETAITYSTGSTKYRKGGEDKEEEKNKSNRTLAISLIFPAIVQSVVKWLLCRSPVFDRKANVLSLSLSLPAIANATCLIALSGGEKKDEWKRRLYSYVHLVKMQTLVCLHGDLSQWWTFASSHTQVTSRAHLKSIVAFNPDTSKKNTRRKKIEWKK